jgi:hypothetical protein
MEGTRGSQFVEADFLFVLGVPDQVSETEVLKIQMEM